MAHENEIINWDSIFHENEMNLNTFRVSQTRIPPSLDGDWASPSRVWEWVFFQFSQDPLGWSRLIQPSLVAVYTIPADESTQTSSGPFRKPSPSLLSFCNSLLSAGKEELAEGNSRTGSGDMGEKNIIWRHTPTKEAIRKPPTAGAHDFDAPDVASLSAMTITRGARFLFLYKSMPTTSAIIVTIVIEFGLILQI